MPTAAAPKVPDEHAAPTAAVPLPVVPKPAAAPRKPVSPPARAARAPVPKPAPSAPPPAKPEAPRQPAGTQVFAGLHVPKVEASITEVKPDGSTGQTVSITKETFIGRGTCEISYPNDTLLSPRHASVGIRSGKVMLTDLGSPNGTFIKQRQDMELAPGDVFLLGRELFRFTTQGRGEGPAAAQGTAVMMGAPKLQRGPVTAKLERIQLSGEVIEQFTLDKPQTTLGRTQGDLIFKNDPYMSGTHARIVAQPGRFILQDLKSRNGVYRRIRGEAELHNGDEFFLGEQLFRVEIKTS